MESEELKPIAISTEENPIFFSPMVVSTPDIEMEMKKISIEDGPFKVPHSVSEATEQSKMSIDTVSPPSNEKSGIGFDVNATMNSVDRTVEDVTINSINKADVTMNSIASQNLEVDYFCDNHVVELSRCTWLGSSRTQRFLKGCHWSPDGTCILTVVNGDGMHVLELPRDLYETESIFEDRPLDVLQSVVHIKEGGTVYDYCWYPFMNSSNPTSCCWLATRQHEPVQMWDAYNGQLRCSYRSYNAVDEVESALSVIFSPDGQNIVAGYKKYLNIFQTDVPGRDYYSIPIKSPASSLAFSLANSLIAVGSWSSTISLIDTRDPNPDSFYHLNGHRGGVTYLRFLEARNMLLSGGRKDNSLLLWDLRNPSNPLGAFTRTVDTNQRIYFDISYDLKWIVSGDTTGVIHAWNLNEGPNIKDQTVIYCVLCPNFDERLTNDDFDYPQFNLHYDCCNGVSMHPTKPIIASSSGQHHFEQDYTIENNNNGENTSNGIVIKKKPRENSLILWWCGKMKRSF